MAARRRLVTLWLQLALLSACGGGTDNPPAPDPLPPPPAASSFRLLPAKVGLVVGGQGAMRALQATGALVWSSSNPQVAGVDSAGVVTALAPGSAVISATVGASVIAGAGAQTRSATVTVHGSSATSAVALIDQALALNRITPEQALIYRVYASFGDARLPAEFDGAPQAAPSHLLMREVSGRLDSLSQAGQDTLLPFLLPPIYAESWHAQQWGPAAATGLAAGARPRLQALSATAGGRARPLILNVNCLQATMPAMWRQSTTAHFNIHYLDPGPQGDLRAQNVAEAIAAVIEDVYSSLTSVTQRSLISDTGRACNGGDGAYDIYVHGWFQAGTAAEVTTYPGACESSPSYMAVNSLHGDFNGAAAQPASAAQRRKVKAVMAHEFLHSLQFTIDRSAACNEYVWIDEATAQWAADHVDPSYDEEDGFDKLTPAATRTGKYLLRYLGSDHMNPMEQPSRDQSATDRGYAGYLFFQYLARRHGSDTLRQIFDAQQAHASVESIQATLAPHGGMKAVWPDFAQTLWLGRAEQVLDYWSTTDRYDYGLANIYAAAPGDPFAQAHTKLRTLAIDQAGQPRATFKLLENAHNFRSEAYEIDPRSLYVEHLKFSDATVHAVLLVNPVAVIPNREFMKLQAVKKIGGVWQPVEDWTADSTKNFCRDKRDERLEELILIVSNSEVNRGAELPFRIPDFFPMRISTSNVGCWRWQGTASTTTTYDDNAGISGQIDGSAVVRWEVSAVLPGSTQFEPRAGFIDGGASGRASGCSFTEVADRRTLDASGLPSARLHINLDLEFGIGDPPNRELTAFDGAASLQATRTAVCPNVTVTSSGPSSFTWLQVDSDATYAISADGQTLEGQYIASFPATRSSITTRFRFTSERE